MYGHAGYVLTREIGITTQEHRSARSSSTRDIADDPDSGLNLRHRLTRRRSSRRSAHRARTNPRRSGDAGLPVTGVCE